MKKINYLLILVMLIFFSQCAKEDSVLIKETVISKEVNIENNRMVFDDEETLNQTIESLLNMNEDELITWYNNNNFESIWLIYHTAYDELEKLTTADDIYKFANKYKDYFEIIVDENGEEDLIEKIDNPIYSRIINKDGEYAFKGKINKIIGNKLVSINEEDYSVVQSLSPTDIIEIAKKDEEIELLNLNNDETYAFKSGNCGSVKEASYTRNERRCKHDRKVILNISTGVVYNSYRRAYVIARVYGKRKFGCIWSRYTTELNLRNVSFSIRYRVNGVPGGNAVYNYYSGTISDSDLESNELVVADYKDDINISSYRQSYFTSVSGKATSRGVGANWAVINCK